MGWNVPDDWGSYYRKCGRCGNTYHASEGGCDCEERDFESLEPCACGACKWDKNDYIEDARCKDCGSGPYHSGRTHRKRHRARKEHNGGSIQPGDLYERRVLFGYYPDGPFTLQVTKHLIRKASDLERLALVKKGIG